MIDFRNDYSQGAAPQVLDKLLAINLDQNRGYGEDPWCAAALARIRDMVGMQRAAAHFVSGGTQANLISISAMLRPHQGVIAADTGHIAAHETGAIEATGHKVLTLPHKDGKLLPRQVQQLVDLHVSDESFEHTVQPGMVYISDSTELGTIYTREELRALSRVCHKKGLLLYLDGARLGYALASEGNDLSIQDIAACCDAFSIGMTKQGALFGEAIVIINNALQKDFRYLIKQRGGMLAKGWLMGAQFEALMADGLYFELSRHAVRLAMLLKEGLMKLGVTFLCASPSNQQFPIFSEEVLAVLARAYGFNRIQSFDDERAAIRLCTSWATQEEDVKALIADVGRALGKV
ncbi:MAG: low specificity L-threonine aldolase [Christensenellales bacterium]